MRNLILLLTLLWSVTGVANIAGSSSVQKNLTLPKQSPLLIRLYLLNADMRFDRDNNQEISNRAPVHLAAGIKKDQIAGVLELTQFSEESGNSTTSIKRTHQEAVAWGRWHFKEFKGRRNQFSFYSGLGLGLFQDQVETTFNSEAVTDKGGIKALAALAGGGEYVFIIKRNWGLAVNAELRMLASSEFDPNPNWGGLIGLGLQF